jgi:phage tail-like protein
VPDPTDPLVAFSFMFEVQNKVAGFFTEVSGIGSETEVVEHKVVTKDGKSDFVQKIPGRLKWGDITLKRGITSELDVYSWRKLVEDGKVATARANGSITMLDQEGKPVAQWDFVRGWPSKVTGPSLNSGTSGVGIEEMVIVHEGIERKK